MKTTTTEHTGWTVIVYRKDGSWFPVAGRHTDGFCFYFRRSVALARARELRKHGHDAVTKRIDLTCTTFN